MVDDYEPFTQFLYVAQIVCCKYYSSLPDLVYLFYKLSERILGGNIKTDRRLIKEQNLGRMEHGCYKISFDALPERHLTDRLVNEFFNAKYVVHDIQRLIIIRLLDAVDVL